MRHYCTNCNYSHINIEEGVNPGQCPECGTQLVRKSNKFDQVLKKDEGKLRMDLIPSEVLIELAKVLTFGLSKGYAEESWKQVEPSRYIAALYRHMTAWRLGEKEDPESHVHHLSHALCNVAFLLYKELNEK